MSEFVGTLKQEKKQFICCCLSTMRKISLECNKSELVNVPIFFPVSIVINSKCKYNIVMQETSEDKPCIHHQLIAQSRPVLYLSDNKW